ncbi:MAG: fasciclin domain-containing protein [Pelobium sp.]
MKKIIVAAFALVAIATASNSYAQKNPMVGGAAMYSTKDIVDNAVNSKDHTTLVAAVKAAGLVETLKSAGPFTVFAPTNAAFDKLPEGTVAFLVKPENKATLTKILTYHVLAGKYSAADIMKAIKKGNGKAAFTTVEGGMLYASMEDGKVKLWDENGGTAFVTIADVNQKNGVIHVIDSVVTPK